MALRMCQLGGEPMIEPLYQTVSANLLISPVIAKKEHFHKRPYRFFITKQLLFVNDSNVIYYVLETDLKFDWWPGRKWFYICI